MLLTAAEWTARINAVRMADGFDSRHGDEWQTLAGPCDWTYLNGLPSRAPVKRQCSRCLTWKVLTEGFRRHPTSSAGYLAMCKRCTNDAQRARRRRQRQMGVAV